MQRAPDDYCSSIQLLAIFPAAGEYQLSLFARPATFDGDDDTGGEYVLCLTYIVLVEQVPAISSSPNHIFPSRTTFKIIGGIHRGIIPPYFHIVGKLGWGDRLTAAGCAGGWEQGRIQAAVSNERWRARHRGYAWCHTTRSPSLRALDLLDMVMG